MNNVTQADPLTPGQLPPGELDLTGRTLADFQVIRHLGQGGMGQVYLAEQISLKRKVALKILRPQLAGDPTALQRFKAEATAVAQATHANIVQVYAIGEAQGMFYMALEYVEGRNLREYLLKKGPPDLLLALSIMRQVASALQRASELGIIHRDIKPENILLTRKGEVKVADFGLARCLTSDRPELNLTQSGVAMGTPLYMSPEQVESRTVDSRTDIYSFGVTCYHMLTGHPPFLGDSPFEVALQHVRDDPKPLTEVRPDLPAALGTIVHKMLAKDPALRYQTGRELLKDISRLREGLSGLTAATKPLAHSGEMVAPLSLSGIPMGTGTVASVTPTDATIAQQPPRRRGRRYLMFGISLLLAAVGGVGIGWLRHRLAFPLNGAVTPVSEEDKTTLPEKNKEAALRTVTESYLNSRPTDAAGGRIGLGLCMDLGLFYLEQDRQTDALAVFNRLEKHRGPAYRILGRAGHAIVLALQSQAKESNDLLRTLAQVRPQAKQRDNLQWMWQSEKWCYWMRKALYYNRQNGVNRKDIPFELQKLMEK